MCSNESSITAHSHTGIILKTVPEKACNRDPNTTIAFPFYVCEEVSLIWRKFLLSISYDVYQYSKLPYKRTWRSLLRPWILGCVEHILLVQTWTSTPRIDMALTPPKKQKIMNLTQRQVLKQSNIYHSFQGKPKPQQITDLQDGTWGREWRCRHGREGLSMPRLHFGASWSLPWSTTFSVIPLSTLQSHSRPINTPTIVFYQNL